VSSQDGLPLPGVTVIAEDAATGLHRSATSSGDGFYRFAALPPARYEVTASLDGFQTVRRAVKVDLGRAVGNDIVMELGAFTETLEVTGEIPLVDVTTSVTGITVNTDELNNQIPVEREVTQVALLAPGTTQGDPAFDRTTPGQWLASFGGASVAENLYVVNGLNITNFRTMLGSSFVPFEFLEEVQIKTGAYEAEFGRSTGGVINMVTKSGTNSFRGGLSLYWEPESLQEQQPDTGWSLNQSGSRERLEGNASLGGPILRDRLFFFGFVRYVDSQVSEIGNIQDNRYKRQPRAEYFENSEPYWGGKLDWNISSNHRLEGTFLSDRTDVDVDTYNYDLESAELADYIGHGVRKRGGESWILKYSGLLGSNALLAVQGGRYVFNSTDRSDGDDCPRVMDYRQSGAGVPLGCWINPWRGVSEDTRDAVRADLDLYLGKHGLRLGVDHETNVSFSAEDRSGGRNYLYWTNTNIPLFPLGTDVATIHEQSTFGSYDTLTSSAYIRDSWALTPNLTLNLGVRWESYDNRNGVGETFIETNDQFAPRLGVIWDPSGQGRQKLYASVGQFYLPVASNTNVRIAGTWNWERWRYVLEGEPDPVDGSPTELGEELTHDLLDDGSPTDPRLVLSSNFDPMSQWELIAGYERLIGRNWSIGIRGIARQFQEVIEDFSIDEGLWKRYGIPCLDPEVERGYCGFEFRLGNPGSDFVGWYDVDGDGELDEITLTADELGYPEAERNYYAVDLTFSKRFSDHWMLEGGYTWSHSYGNYEGYTESVIGQSDPGLTQTFDYPGLLDHGYGDLPNDRRHNFKLYGAYSWDFGLQVGGFFSVRSGRPINSLGLHPTDPFAQMYGAYSFFTGGEPCPRGCMGTSDAVWVFDGSLQYSFDAAGIDWKLRVDVFNLFDNDTETVVDEYGEDNGGAPNPYHMDPISFQRPRSVRFGVGMSF
jgi:outer membrane receptor protein involved in Fe transport